MSKSTTSSLPTFQVDFGSIRSMLEYRFTIKDAYVDINGLPTFVIVEEPIKEKFQELLLDLRNHHLTARIQRVAGNLVISVFPKPNLGKPRLRTNLILFLAKYGIFPTSSGPYGNTEGVNIEYFLRIF